MSIVTPSIGTPAFIANEAKLLGTSLHNALIKRSHLNAAPILTYLSAV